MKQPGPPIDAYQFSERYTGGTWEWGNALISLYARAVEQWAAFSLYGLLLDSAAAEHSTRYQLMESATQNADRLIEELTLAVQAARRHAITREM